MFVFFTLYGKSSSDSIDFLYIKNLAVALTIIRKPTKRSTMPTISAEREACKCFSFPLALPKEKETNNSNFSIRKPNAIIANAVLIQAR